MNEPYKEEVLRLSYSCLYDGEETEFLIRCFADNIEVHQTSYDGAYQLADSDEALTWAKVIKGSPGELVFLEDTGTKDGFIETSRLSTDSGGEIVCTQLMFEDAVRLAKLQSQPLTRHTVARGAAIRSINNNALRFKVSLEVDRHRLLSPE